MKNKLSRFNGEALPSNSKQKKIAELIERIPRSNRIVLFGSITSGSPDFVKRMRYEGSPEIENLQFCRDTSEIRDAFFGIGQYAPTPTAGSPESSQEMTLPQGALVFNKMVTKGEQGNQIVTPPKDYIENLGKMYGVDVRFVVMDYPNLAELGRTDLGRLGTKFAALPPAPLE